MFLILFSRRMRGAHKAVGKRMTCHDFIFEMGARAHKERMAQSCSRAGTRMKRDDQRHPVLTLF